MELNELKDLWIGDWVRVTLTGATGKFEGEKDGKAIVVIGVQRQLIDPRYLEISEAPEDEKSLLELLGLAEEQAEEKKEFIDNTLDLHLEKLTSFSPDAGLSILDFQIRECRRFLSEIIRRKLGSAIIIHGKGDGVLKEQIIHILADYPEIKHFFSRNQGGALELLLYY